jgi:hypothetical protein
MLMERCRDEYPSACVQDRRGYSKIYRLTPARSGLPGIPRNSAGYPKNLPLNVGPRPMSHYVWSCPACKASNLTNSSQCSVCGCQAQASRAEIDLRKAAMARLDVSKLSLAHDLWLRILSVSNFVSLVVLLALPFVALAFWLTGTSDWVIRGLVIGGMGWGARKYLSRRLAGRPTSVTAGVIVEASDSPGTKFQSDVVALLILVSAIAFLARDLLKVVHTL